MDRVRNALAFAALGVVFAAAGLWMASWSGPPPWLLAGLVVIFVGGAGYTTFARTQLGLLTAAVLTVVAMPFVAAGQFGARQVQVFLLVAVATAAAWLLIFRRALKRQWSERWIDAPVEYAIGEIDLEADDRTETLERLGFTPSCVPPRRR